MKRNEMIDLIVVRSPGTKQQLAQLRHELSGKTTTEIEKIVDEQNLAQIRAQVAQRFDADKEQKNREFQQRERERIEEAQLLRIFCTPINGMVAVDNQANRGIIRSWIDETRDERISPAWFLTVLNENPKLIESLALQSADVLNPVKRQQTAAAQEHEDRKTFNEFARQNGWSEVQANFHLAKSILGSGFNQFALANAVRDGRLNLAPASQEELARFQTEAAQARADYLRNHASPEELRNAAHEEAEQRRTEFKQQEADRQLAARKEQDANYGYPPLPEFNTAGDEPIRIDATFLNKLSNTDLPKFKNMLRKYGSFQLTQRLRGLA